MRPHPEPAPHPAPVARPETAPRSEPAPRGALAGMFLLSLGVIAIALLGIGANGFASVGGAVRSVLLAMLVGFRATVVLAGVAPVAGFLVIRLTRRSRRGGRDRRCAF